MGCFLASLTAKAQWVVSDPGNLAQGIINAAKNIVHTSSTATNMANNFQETVKSTSRARSITTDCARSRTLSGMPAKSSRPS